jgi:manganese/zinc/iron transport system substrate-binding protein
MKKILLAWICLLVVWSCSSERNAGFRTWIENNGKIKVLSTTAMINDLVQQIGKDHVDTLTLIQGQLDPHSYQLVKGDDEKLVFAQLIFYNGLGLEHGPSLYYHLSDNPKAIALGDQIEQQDPSSIIYVQGQKDPHIWMDISLWNKAVPVIVEALSKKDPAHAAEFRANGAALQQTLLQAHEQIKSIVHSAPEQNRYLVTSHDAFNYFTRAYLAPDNERHNGLWEKRFAAPEGLAPESQLSTTDIRSIIDHMQKYHIKLLFSESNVSQDSIKKILQAGRERGLDLKIACCPLFSDAMGPPSSEADTYTKMLLYNAKMITRYMKEEN